MTTLATLSAPAFRPADAVALGAMVVSATFLFTLAQIVVAAVRRIYVARVGVFFGPVLRRLMIGPTELWIHAIPVGAYVKFQTFADDAAGVELPKVPRLRRYAEVGPWERVILCLSGPAVLLLGGVLILGPAGAWHSFLTTFAQFLRGCLSPATVPGRSLSGFAAILNTQGWGAATGTAWTKVAAFNCLPSGAAVGGLAIWEALQGVTRQRFSNAAFQRAALATTIPFFLGLVLWIGGVIWFFVESTGHG